MEQSQQGGTVEGGEVGAAVRGVRRAGGRIGRWLMEAPAVGLLLWSVGLTLVSISCSVVLAWIGAVSTPDLTGTARVVVEGLTTGQDFFAPEAAIEPSPLTRGAALLLVPAGVLAGVAASVLPIWAAGRLVSDAIRERSGQAGER